MKSIPAESHVFEFCFIELDYTLVRVEERGGQVIIRATANTFSRERKRYFIRELAAEGFIPDDLGWSPFADSESFAPAIRWVVDCSWLRLDEGLIARHRRLVRRFILPVALSWLLIVYLAFPGREKTAGGRPEEHAHPAAAISTATVSGE